uniref:GRANULINS domain-containing protein n=1 Tax=Steinernema glaseri TaxID=37863 RepID=A0A1I7ZIP9_9BILA
MRCLLCASLLSLLIVVVRAGKWSCGSERVIFSTRSSEFLIWLTCPYGVPEVLNQCCRTHDECYCTDMSRHECDASFCSCIRSAARRGNLGCRSIVSTSCAAVRALGAASYQVNCPLEAAPDRMTQLFTPKSR